MPIRFSAALLLAALVWLLTVRVALSADYLEADVLAYEQQDVLFPPPAGAIVVTGSSTINWWYSMRNDLAPLDVLPRGFGGSTADDLDYYLDRLVLKYAPRAVVIYEGDNDIAWGRTPQHVADKIAQIAGRITARFPNSRVYVISIKPSPLRWNLWPLMQQANQLLVSFCATDPRCRYIDTASVLLGTDGVPVPGYYASDALHLSASGYAVWTSAIWPVLMAAEQAEIVRPTLRGEDIGAVAAAGSTIENGGVFAVRGSGQGVTGTSDEFHYSWRSLVGDGQITARVVSQTNTATSAKAGVMFRGQLNSAAINAFMFVTPSAGSFLQYRTVIGGATGPTLPVQPGIAAPYWLRLVRRGDVVTGYNSPDGMQWTERGSVTFGDLPDTLYVGLAVSSAVDGVLGTARFDNVYVFEAVSPPPVDVLPPSVPTGLKATVTSSSQVNLTWNASSDNVAVAGYRVFRNGTAAATTATTSYADSGLAANTLYTYTVSAYDGATPRNESAQSTAANATTLPANVVPVLTNPGNQSGTVGTAVSLQVVGTDADGDTLTYSAAGLPSGLAIEARSGRISGTLSAAGTFNVTLSVSDGRGGTDMAGFSWTIAPPPPVNVPPTLTSTGRQRSTVGTAVSLQIVATDPDGDVLVYAVVNPPIGLSINADTGLINGTPTTAGSFDVTLTVSDGRGGMDTESLSWIVEPANVAPTLTNPGNQNGTVGMAVSVLVVATDPDGNPLAYAAANLPSGLSIDSSTGLINGTPNSTGTFNVSLAVSDGRGGADTEVITWTVAPAKPTSGGGSLGWAGAIFLGLAGLLARGRHTSRFA